MRKKISVAKYHRTVKYHARKVVFEQAMVDAEFILKMRINLRLLSLHATGDGLSQDLAMPLTGVVLESRVGCGSDKVYWHNIQQDTAWILFRNYANKVGMTTSVCYRLSRPWNLMLFDEIRRLGTTLDPLLIPNWKGTLPNRLLTSPTYGWFSVMDLISLWRDLNDDTLADRLTIDRSVVRVVQHLAKGEIERRCDKYKNRNISPLSHYVR